MVGVVKLMDPASVLWYFHLMTEAQPALRMYFFNQNEAMKNGRYICMYGNLITYAA
jgi:hypothetical protein